MLRSLLPQNANPTHPLFVLNMRRRRWWKTGDNFIPFSRYVLVWSAVFWLSLFIIFVVSYGLYKAYVTPLQFRTYSFVSDIGNPLLFAALIAIGFGYLFDLFVLATTLNVINGEQRHLRWDLIRLTPQTPQSLVQALYDAGVMRVWRMTMILAGVRVAIVLGLALTFFVVMPVVEGTNIFVEMWESFIDYPMDFLGATALIGIMTVVFIAEPVWRMRSTVALGMAISAQVRSLVTAFVLAFPMMLFVWATMLGILWGTAFGMGSILFNFDIYDFEIWFFAVLFGVLGWMVYGLFRQIRERALRWTMRRAFIERTRWEYAQNIPRPFVWVWWQPHSEAPPNTPLLMQQARNLKWWCAVPNPAGVALWTMSWSALFSAFVMLVGMIWFWEREVGFILHSAYAMSNWRNDSRMVLLSVLTLGWFLALPLDSLVMLSVANGARRWERAREAYALNLHPMRAFLGIRAAARLRQWRLVSIITGVRVGLVLIGGLVTLLNIYLYHIDALVIDRQLPELLWYLLLYGLALLIAFFWPMLQVRLGASVSLLLTVFVGRRGWWWLTYATLVLLMVVSVFSQLFLFIAIDWEWDAEEGIAILFMVMLVMLAIEQAVLAIIRWRATIRAAK